MDSILVVDDEPRHRLGLVNMLRTLRPQYEILEAKNGKDALAAVANASVKIVITDIQMPVLDGLEFLEAVHTVGKNVKVIILSGYAYFEYAQTALRLGAFDFVLKPVNKIKVDEMLLKVEKCFAEEEGLCQDMEELTLHASQREEPSAPSHLENSEMDIIHRCQAYMDAHFAEDLSLDSLAGYFQFNASYFSSLFKKSTGATFSEYLHMIRMKKAIELLKGSKLKVYEIAAKAGYHNEKYFHRVFKKEFGITPEELRRNNV